MKISRVVHFSSRCDADPSALANYVVALVKKDKPDKELRALCADQLDVFLQKGKLCLICRSTLMLQTVKHHAGGTVLM